MTNWPGQLRSLMTYKQQAAYWCHYQQFYICLKALKGPEIDLIILFIPK